MKLLIVTIQLKYDEMPADYYIYNSQTIIVDYCRTFHTSSANAIVGSRSTVFMHDYLNANRQRRANRVSTIALNSSDSNTATAQ